MACDNEGQRQLLSTSPSWLFLCEENATNYYSPILMYHKGLISYQEKPIPFKMQTNAG